MKQKQILDEEGIREGTGRLAEQIIKGNSSPGNMVLVGVITRGVTLAERIRQMIGRTRGIEVEIGALDTRPCRDDLKEEVSEDRTNMPFSINQKDVILVDDVMSTGRTMRAAMDALIKYGRPRSIKSAVLVDVGHRELPITADYVGVEVPTSISEKVKVRLREVDGGRDRAVIQQ